MAVRGSLSRCFLPIYYYLCSLSVGVILARVKLPSLEVSEFGLVQPQQNVAAIPAASDPVVAALGLVGRSADGAGH